MGTVRVSSIKTVRVISMKTVPAVSIKIVTAISMNIIPSNLCWNSFRNQNTNSFYQNALVLRFFIICKECVGLLKTGNVQRCKKLYEIKKWGKECRWRKFSFSFFSHMLHSDWMSSNKHCNLRIHCNLQYFYSTVSISISHSGAIAENWTWYVVRLESLTNLLQHLGKRNFLLLRFVLSFHEFSL